MSKNDDLVRRLRERNIVEAKGPVAYWRLEPDDNETAGYVLCRPSDGGAIPLYSKAAIVELKNDLATASGLAIDHRDRANRAETALEAAKASNKALRTAMTLAHAVMRECGWQLAPAAEPQSDGVLELACAEIEEKFAALLALEQDGGAE